MPLDKYNELEPILLGIVKPQNDGDILHQVTTILKEVQSGDFSHYSALRQKNYEEPPSSLIEDFGGGRDTMEYGSLFNILKGIVDKYAEEDKKQGCLDALNNLEAFCEIDYSKKWCLKSSRSKAEYELSGIFYETSLHIEPWLRHMGYQDIADSLHKLTLKAGLYAAKSHHDDEQRLSQGLFDSDRLGTVGSFGKELSYGLFVLGDELAKLLSRVASKTYFDIKLLSNDYDFYCEIEDRNDVLTVEEEEDTPVEPAVEARISRRMSRLISRTQSVCPRSPSLYEAVEEKVRERFRFLDKDKRLLLFRNVRIFLLALRDIVRNHSDAAAEKQAIKKALAVLEAFNQTELSLKESTKDVVLDISAEQQQDIAKLKEIAVPEVTGFIEKMNHIEDTGDGVAPFLREIEAIIESTKNRFLEESKSSFDFIVSKLIFKLDEKARAEGEKNLRNLNVKIAEIKEQLAGMPFHSMIIPLFGQRLDPRFSLPGSVIRNWRMEGVLGPIRGRDIVNLLEHSRYAVRAKQVDYLLGLAKYRMSLEEKLYTMLPVPAIMSKLQSLKTNELSEELLDEGLKVMKECANLQAEPYQRWVTELGKLLPVVEEFDIYKAIDRLMSGTDGKVPVLFDFDTKDGHFGTKVIREGDTIKDVEYSAIPGPKFRRVPVQLHEFFATVDSDPRNVEKLAAMLENFSPEMLEHVYFDNGDLPQWATISKRLVNIKQKGINDKEKLYMLYALATVSDDMDIEQVQNHLAKYVKDPQTTLSTLSQDDFIWSDGYDKGVCVPDRMKLFLLFNGKVNSEFQKDLLLTDAELNTEFFKYSLEKEIDASKLCEKLSQGSRYEEKGNAYFIEVFLRALEIVFNREDKCYFPQTNVESGKLICKDLSDDIQSKEDNLKFFITDVVEGKVPLEKTVSSSLRIISLLTGKSDFTDIGSINYLFRTLERRIDEYRKTKARNEGAGDAVTKEAKQKEENGKFEITNLIGALIQGLSHCPQGRALAVHHVTNGMVKTDKNVEKVSVEDALKYSIQMCSNYYFDSIFHFVSSHLYGDFTFNVAESQKIKGIDLGKVGLDPEEIMTRGTILRMFNGDYGLSRYNGLPDTLETTVNALHLYVLSQVGRGNMTVLKVMKDLYNSQDEAVRKYGADYSTGEIGEKFYAWASPIEIKGQTAQLYAPGIGYVPTSVSQKKLLRALMDEPMQNIHNVTEYVSGENCDFIWNIVESKLTAGGNDGESDADAVLKTKEMVFDATDDSGEKYENYLNKRIAFYLLKKHNLLKVKSQNNNN